MTRDEVVEYARRWIGTPFVHQQRVCQSGGDCVAMCEDVALHFGIIEKSYRTDYGPSPMMREILNAIRQSGCERLPNVTLRQPGDLAFIKWKAKPQHLGIISHDDRIIHGYSSAFGAGKYEEVMMGQRILDGLCSVWRLPGIED